MKQMETIEKKIGESTFYLRPFPAFVAANISGDLAAVISPVLGSLTSLVGNGDNASIMNIEMDRAIPALSSAFNGLSGDAFERLMKKLLVDHKNVSVEGETTGGDVKQLTLDLANEVFCGEIQDMYILCWEVIKLNFGGFFKKLGAQSGNLQGIIQTATPR